VADRTIWLQGPVWSDETVDSTRVLLLRDPLDLEGSPVVIRALTASRRPGLARVERSDKGSERRVHPELARQLGTRDERFQAEWRRASWYDVLTQNRMSAALIFLTALGTAASAVIGFNETEEKVGWGIAVLVLLVGVGTLLVKARKEWNEWKP
jgi:hypothetical protein